MIKYIPTLEGDTEVICTGSLPAKEIRKYFVKNGQGVPLSYKKVYSYKSMKSQANEFSWTSNSVYIHLYTRL